MKRLLKISFDLALLSFVPILSWFCLSLIIDRSLINIFTLTYPIQFISYILISIFSTGANISSIKDRNKNAVMSAILIGSIVGFIIYSLFVLNIDKYINFMNMDSSLYRNFTLYYVIFSYIQLIFNFILNKLYYEEKNTLANKYSFIFNTLSFFGLIGSALIFKSQITVIAVTLSIIIMFTVYVAIKVFNKFRYNLNLFNCIKYDSVELFNNIAFFFIFLFGLSNAMEFGEEFTLALTFVALITDTQWDTFDAIKIVAQIDISKNKFNYKEHINNAYKLLLVLLVTVVFMFMIFYSFYNLNINLVIIYFGFELVNFIIYPVYRIKTCYLQIEYSPIIMTTNKVFSSILRMLVSLIKSPFCTGIGQVSSSLYQLFSVSCIFNKNYRIADDGRIVELS